MLIIEGADCVGKTTLQKEFVKRLNAANMPHVPHHLSRLPDSFDRYHGYKRLCNTTGVFDRFHMSEIAYQYGRREELGSYGLTTEKYRQVDGMLRLHGSYVVVLSMEPSDAPELLQQRWDQSREMYDQALVLHVNEWYDTVSRQWGMWNQDDKKDTYVMDVDAVFHETLTVPFPTVEFIDEVIEQYVARLVALHTTSLQKESIVNLCPLSYH